MQEIKTGNESIFFLKKKPKNQKYMYWCLMKNVILYWSPKSAKNNMIAPVLLGCDYY